MIINNSVWNSPVRTIAARVELFEGSTPVGSHSYTDAIKKFTVERVGTEGKFFGFGICQRLNLHLIDTKREIEYGTQHSCKCYLNDLDSLPTFKISEVRRDENTNELSITAYDALYDASAHTIDELALTAPYAIGDIGNAIADFLGLRFVVNSEYGMSFGTLYENGANFEGTETLREVLDAMAEATQTVYYIDCDNNLVFKQPDRNGEPVLIIGKADYIKLDSKTNRRLSDICSATELGDNVITESGMTGTIQYVRDNPFWELREDITTLLNDALAAIGGLTINQFDCTWRGNPGLEICDKIALTTKDDKTVISYVFNDVIEYDGSLKQKTSWEYPEKEDENHNNPVSLGDALKKTYAKVDKANQQIEIVAGETAEIRMANDSIQSTVRKLDEDMGEVLAEVNTKVSADEMSISIQEAMDQGISAITTTTGFTFNAEGLFVSKSGSDITTVITEDGMTVSRGNDDVLVADNLGVKAEDLHATTFLIVGENSRFEDYGRRTGCFWIRN